MAIATPQSDAATKTAAPKRFYSSVWLQVSVVIAIAIVFGYVNPAHWVAMKRMDGPSSA